MCDRARVRNERKYERVGVTPVCMRGKERENERTNDGMKERKRVSQSERERERER